uniref:AH domain-containing protein n=1 Tax=Plectus sambesii TaxID=2011161 RepID=A0A914ULL9_9BILA
MMSESAANPFVDGRQVPGSNGSLTLDTDTNNQHAAANVSPYSRADSPSAHDTSSPYAATGKRLVDLCFKTYDIGDVHSKLDSLKQWSISTYKCTKQAVYEHLGKTQRTLDPELEQRIEQTKDLQKRYLQLLQLSRSFTSFFNQMTTMQSSLAEAMNDLAQKEPRLRDEFTCNSEAQKTIAQSAQTLMNALNFFLSTMETLCEKTIEDTLKTVRSYDQARLQYDAYRMDLAVLQQQGGAGGSASEFQGRLYEAEHNCQTYKSKYEQLRDDIQVKLRFLDENRVKVMKKQLLLFHNATCAYFSGNNTALEASLKQFHIASNDGPSFLEQ